MNDLLILLDEVQNDILKVVITSPFYKSEEYKKIVIEQKESSYLVSKYYETKVSHENIKSDFAKSIFDLADGYKNINIFTTTEDITVLANKKGSINIKRAKQKQAINVSKSHNREKNYILKEGEKIDFLIHLKVMNKDGMVHSQYMKKFKQINKFLELIKKHNSEKIDENKISKDMNDKITQSSNQEKVTFADSTSEVVELSNIEEIPIVENI